MTTYKLFLYLILLFKFFIHHYIFYESMNDYVYMPVISVANKLLIESSRQSATHKPTH